MKNRIIIARFLLVFMLSVCLLPFSALAVEAVNTDENEEFFKKIAGTYTWTGYRENGFGSANEYREYVLSNTDEWQKDDIVESEESSPEFGGGAFSDYVIWYALSCMELKVDQSGNVSGKQSGTLSLADKNPDKYYGVHDFDYSIEVTSHITDKNQSPDFHITGTVNKIYRFKSTEKSDLNYSVTLDLDGTLSTDFSYKTNTNKYYNPVRLNMDNEEICLSGSIYYDVDLKYTYTVNEGKYYWGLKKGEQKSSTGRASNFCHVCWSKPYTYVPTDDENTDIEIFTEAGDEEGIEVSEVIPAVVIGGGVIGIGRAISKKNKKKNNANNKKKEKAEKKEEKKEDEQQSTYRMVLYKDFGSILMMGDQAKKVCARIEEVTPEGVVKKRGDLTAAIEITGVENIKVESTGLDGKYKYAMVKVQPTVSGSIPEKAVVRFFYKGAGGSFANNVSFNVFAPLIEFNADGLCFIAGEKQTFEIPFDVLVPEGVEMPLDNFSFSVETPDSSDFEAAIITTEDGLAVRVADTYGGNNIAGYTDDNVITVKAEDSAGNLIAKGAFPAVRFHEGLRLNLGDIKCYLIDAGNNPEEKYTDDRNVKKGYAITRVDVCLYAFDRENNCMSNPVLQESEIKFIFEDVKGSCNIYDQDDNKATNFCQILDFQYKLLGVAFNNNTAVGMITPGKGLLMPPTRFKAKVTCEVTWQGKTYTDSKTVLCASQKRRTDSISEDMTTSEYIKACLKITDPDYDEKKTKKLEIMKLNLMREDYKLNQMVPFIKKIQVMLMGYDSTYGYYEPDFKRVSEAYIKWLNGEFTPSEVNKRVFDTGDENYWSDFGNYMFYNATESGWGTAVRIGCGILTGGASEWAYLPMEVYNKMEDAYVYKNMSARDTIWIGAVVVIEDMATSKGMETVGQKVVPFVSDLLNKSQIWRYCAKEVKDYFSKYNKRITVGADITEGAKKLLNRSKTYRDVAEELQNLYKRYNCNIEFGAGGISLTEREASMTLDQISTAAERKAKSEIVDFRKNYDLNDTERTLSEAYSRSRQDGLVKIKNFRDALSEGGEEAGKAALEIGKQKTALRQAETILTKTEKGQLYRYRKDYIDAGTDAIQEGLMRERGIPKDKLSIEFVSSKSEAELLGGAKVNSDFDINVYYTTNDGKKVLLDSRLYKDYFTEAYCRKAGIEAASRVERECVLKSHDITLMDKNHADYLGEEVNKITNKNLQGMKFEKPDAMFSGYRNKMVDPHHDAMKALKEADALEKAGYKDMADDLRQLASRCEGEGHRTIGKAYDVVIDGRLREAIAQGNAPVQAEIMKIKQKISVIKESEKMLDPGEVDAFFRTKYGQSYEEVVDEINSFGKRVNDGLGDFSGNLWKTYSGSKIGEAMLNNAETGKEEQ